VQDKKLERFHFSGHAGNAPAATCACAGGYAHIATLQPGVAPIRKPIRASTSSVSPRATATAAAGFFRFMHRFRNNLKYISRSIPYVCTIYVNKALKWPSAAGFCRFHFVISAAFDRIMKRSEAKRIGGRANP
jgi:hypothetical protein